MQSSTTIEQTSTALQSDTQQKTHKAEQQSVSKTLPAEKQQYLNVLGQKKSLYAVNEILGEAQDLALQQTHDPNMMQIAKKLNVAEQINTASISRLYAQQIQIEQKYPQFKSDAVAYAKKRQLLHQQSQQPHQLEPGF